MRLTCPNCAAQYEVPADVIPQEGRDVQCSACGHTWFQAKAQPAASEDALEPAGAAAEAPQPETELAPPPERRPARGIDPAVADILREEASRENSLRSRDQQSLESQPELGLDDHGDDSERRAREAQARMARLRGEQPAAREDSVPAQRNGGRAMLPDIEEINSSLRAGTDRTPARRSDDELPPRRSGFMRGFALSLILVAALLLIYANAPRIAAMVPQADPALSAYVALVDDTRLWLNGTFATYLPR